MLVFAWNDEKDRWLRENRGLGFAQVVHYLSEDGWLDELKHPDQKRYPGQRIYVVLIEDYVWLVPFVKDGQTLFLKTAIPSRKMTRLYRGEGERENKKP